MPDHTKPPVSTVGVEPAAEEANQDIAIFPHPGRCANCKQRIRLLGEPTGCPSCEAWRRWYQVTTMTAAALRRAGQ